MNILKLGIIATALILSCNVNAASFNFSLPNGTSNVSGIAVDSTSGDIYMSTLSYGGQDNLWQFSPTGALINSTRIDYDLGWGGNYSLAAVGPNNKIYSYAAEANGDGTHSRKIVQLDSNGTNVQTLQNLDAYNGVFGIDFNASSNEFILGMGSVGNEFIIHEMTLNGTILSSSTQDPVAWGWDIAFDSSADRLLSLRGYSSTYSKALDVFMSDGAGNYTIVDSYDISHLGSPHTLGINNSNGLIYAVDNNTTLHEFSLSELSSCLPECSVAAPPPPPPSEVPLPAAVWLFGSGLIGLAGFARRKKT